MKISIKLMPLLSRMGYRHFHCLSLSHGKDGLILTVLMIGLVVRWGESLKEVKS